jgi:peroxiredoxin
VRRYRWILSWFVLLIVLVGCQATASSTTPPDEPTVKPRPPAPDFALENLSGETLRLSDDRGQMVLVNFWASWCPPCQDEIPALEAYYQAHQDEDVVILGVTVKDSERSLTEFLEEYEVSFPVLLDRDAKVAGTYNVTGLPTSVLVDREGRIAWTWPGMVTKTFLEKNVTPLLEEE